MLFSLAKTSNEKQEECVKKPAFFDVSRAYFYAPATKNVSTKPPDEDSEEGMCGRLSKSMFGTRDTAKNWGGENQ